MERQAGMTTTLRTRLMAALSALAMTLGLLALTTAPASAAAMRCNHDNGISFNACLTIEYAGDGLWDVHVGFDRYLPKSYADEVLGCPGGGVFFSVLWGDDGGHPDDDELVSIPLDAGWPRTGSNPAGMFAEFSRQRVSLDEDSGTDEVYAEVTYFDCHNGQWFTYRTGTHVGTF
jgi:hypothetical protein